MASEPRFHPGSIPIRRRIGVIDLVAGVGLWLAAPWGAVVWLTSVISMAAVELLFPQIYGGNIWTVMTEVVLLGTYLWLALMAAREQPG